MLNRRSIALTGSVFYQRLLMGVALAAAVLLLSACAETPSHPAPAPHHAARTEQPPPAPQPVNTQVFVYPTSGQSADRVNRDRYECYLWSVKQSGFDPSQAQLAPHQRVEVVPVPPSGTNTVAGAATGAVLGAIIANPHDAAAGAVGGAVVGGALGAIADSQHAQQVKQVQSRYDQRTAAQNAQLEGQASSYRRALTACLEGRGYTVK
ncbi:MAG TPA: glycine zipper 2TM domain-containing protein [Steroidobacteraceae bacterium]